MSGEQRIVIRAYLGTSSTPPPPIFEFSSSIVEAMTIDMANEFTMTHSTTWGPSNGPQLKSKAHILIWLHFKMKLMLRGQNMNQIQK